MRVSIKVLFVVALFALFSSCTKKEAKPILWIYTSAYNHVVQDLTAKLNQNFPNVEFKFFQSGSENVAAKLQSEFMAGKPQADLILTSDPFWYEQLKKDGRLLSYQSEASKYVPSSLRDSENYYTTVRVPVMAITYHSDFIKSEQAPKSFHDLTNSKFKNKVVMGSALESGTVFTSVAMLHKKLDWKYFQKLRENGAISTGGNSAVMNKVESGERPVGMVLLENILVAQRKNSKIKAVYPEEGLILVPSPIAILSTTKNAELSKKVYDFFFSKNAQEAFVKGDMYSIDPGVASPVGAKSWNEVYPKALLWTNDLLKEVYAERDHIKQKFTKIMLE